MYYDNKNSYKKGTIALFGFSVLVNTALCSGNNDVQTLNQKGFIGKTLAAMATSDMMHRYNEFLKTDLQIAGDPASEIFQALSKEAQTAVGIPAERHVPIRNVAGLDGGMAAVNAIEVGEECYSQHAYGVKRCDMFHETIHIKYHDFAFSTVPFFGSLFGIPLATKLIIKPQGIFNLLYLPSLVAGCFLGRAVLSKFYAYRERRADIEGHYATQCHVCVTEKAEQVRNMVDDLNNAIDILEAKSDLNENETMALDMAKDFIKRKKGYLSADENEIIAADLKRDKKICVFHASDKKDAVQ